ncbi:MAG: hypothetical protein ABI847_17235 [Anaerolineales bacterium]
MTAAAPPPVPAGQSGPAAAGGMAGLRHLIAQVAGGTLPVQALITSFRRLHESIERTGQPVYRSKEEARLIWDLLWALEFYSPDPGRQANPAEWNDDAAILEEVQRVNERLQAL